jgi:hypothetical protein
VVFGRPQLRVIFRRKGRNQPEAEAWLADLEDRSWPIPVGRLISPVVFFHCLFDGHREKRALNTRGVDR